MRDLRRAAGLFPLVLCALFLGTRVFAWQDLPGWGRVALAGLASGVGVGAAVLFEAGLRAGGLRRFLSRLPLFALPIGAAFHTSWYAEAGTWSGRALAVVAGSVVAGIACVLLDAGEFRRPGTDPSVFD